MDAKRLDLVVLSLMAFIAIFSGYMFFASPVDRATISQDILGVLEQGFNVVKVRPGGAPFWKDAKTNDQLGDRDLVYTHNNSGANIRLKLGGMISLHENTLFRLVKGSEGKALIDLRKGAIKAFLLKGTKLRLSGSSSVVSNTDSEVLIYSDAGKKKFSLVKGKLSVKQGGRSLVLKKGQELVFDKEDKVTVTNKLDIGPLSPLSSEVIYYQQSAEVVFKWKQSDSARGKQVVSISRTPDFKNSTIVARKVRLKGDGRFYWKVGLHGPSGTRWSSPFDFILKKDIVPQITSPASGTVALEIDPIDQSESSFVTLKWMNSKAAKYKVMLTAPSGSTREYLSESNAMPVDLFELGKYSVQVTALFANRSVLGESSSFQIIEKSRPTIPTLIFPKDKASFSVFDKLGVGVRFTWHSPRLDSESVIEVLDLKGSLVSSQRVRGSSVFLKINRFGKFVWRVRSESGTLHSAFSGKSSFTIKYTEINAKYPETGNKFQLSRPKQTVRFEWGGTESAKLYLYELSKTESFDDIVYTKKVRGKKINVNFPSVGVFFWRTKVFDEKGGLSFSRPVKVIVSPTPPPVAPVLDPTQYFEIDLRKGAPSSFFKRVIDFIFPPVFASDGTEANISWKKYGNAAKYVLEIYRDPKGKNLVIKRIVDTNSFSFINPEPGEYYWRIAIIDHWGRKGPFSNFAVMKLKLSERLTPIESADLLLPRHRQAISNKQVFAWRSVARSKRYTIQFSKDLSFKNLVYSKSTTKEKISLKLLKYKDIFPLYWRVLSLDGYKNSSLSKRRIIYLPIVRNITVDNKTAPFIPNHRASIRIGAAAADYKLEHGSNTYSADGTLPILSLSGEGDFVWGKLISDLSLIRGKVYEQDFFVYSASLSGGRRLYRSGVIAVDWFLGVRVLSVPVYNPPKAVGNPPESNGAEPFIVPVGAFNMIYSLSQSELFFFGELGALSILSYRMDMGWRYLLKRQDLGFIFSLSGVQGNLPDEGTIQLSTISAAFDYSIKF